MKTPQIFKHASITQKLQQSFIFIQILISTLNVFCFREVYYFVILLGHIRRAIHLLNFRFILFLSVLRPIIFTNEKQLIDDRPKE